MKTLFLASALALSVGTHAAFAAMTIFSDGSTYDSAGLAKSYASNTLVTTSDTAVWHRGAAAKVVRLGPPEGGLGGA